MVESRKKKLNWGGQGGIFWWSLKIFLDLEYMVMLSWPFFTHLSHGEHITTADYIRFAMAMQGTIMFSLWMNWTAIKLWLNKKKDK